MTAAYLPSPISPNPDLSRTSAGPGAYLHDSPTRSSPYADSNEANFPGAILSPARKSSTDSYLPTPQSGSFLLQQQQQQQQQQQPQRHLDRSMQDFNPSPQSASRSQSHSHTHAPSRSPHPSQTTRSPAISPSTHQSPSSQAYMPTPQMSEYSHSSQVAGPSAYRRTPNVHSPLSTADNDDLRLDPSTPVRAKPRGRMTAQGEQVMMDGMERMQVDEGDGRIGMDEPCERDFQRECRTLTVS